MPFSLTILATMPNRSKGSAMMSAIEATLSATGLTSTILQSEILILQ